MNFGPDVLVHKIETWLQTILCLSLDV
jgi:hypothetical protein